MRRQVFEVPGISCGHCKRAIEAEVAEVPGVRRVAVDVDRKLVEVEGSAGEPEVAAAIAEAGYEVVSGPR
jgi:copper chaperone CopZ